MGEILLEAGTNELELLIFTVGDQKFGVNIAKVLEIMQYQHVTKIPASNPAFEGVFMPRDKVISVVNLHTMLKREKPTNTDGLFLVCHFNKMDTAKRTEIAALDGAQLAAIVQDMNGTYWYLGKDNWVSTSAVTGQTGAGMDDGNFYTVTLTDTSSELPYTVDPDIIAGLLNS